MPDAGPERSLFIRKLPLIISATVVLVFLGCYFLWPFFHHAVKSTFKVLTSGDRELISNWVGQFDAWGPVFLIMAMVLQMFVLVISVSALMIVAVLAYGPLWGSLIALTGISLASTLSFTIGRLLGENTVEKLIGHKTQVRMQHFVERYGFWAVVVVRISPLISNDGISLVAGLARMRYLPFMGATLAGILPLTMLIAWLSTEIDNLKTGLIWISVISLLGFGIYVWLDRRNNPNHANEDTDQK